jgi:hypothetical protein
MIQLPNDFKEFLKSLSGHEVRYLLVGGYAVTYHGYARSTGDLNIWIPREWSNAERLERSIREFGFDEPELSPELFLSERTLVRMGRPPLQIEILSSVSGLEFDQCYEHRIVERWDDVDVTLISLADLRTNKRAAGRPKDIEDINRLPEK